ncbi:MAG TPA: hypothetical protein VGG79_08540 [Roseiarcus sp.]
MARFVAKNRPHLFAARSGGRREAARLGKAGAFSGSPRLAMVCLDNREMFSICSYSEFLARPGRQPDGRGRLFQKERRWLDHNRRASREGRADFFIPNARNLLKRLDSKK